MTRNWSTLAWGILFLTPLLCLAQNTDNAAPLAQIEAQATRIFNQSVDALVRVHAYAQADAKSGVPAYRVSTGFIIDAKGWVATTASNVAGADRIIVEWRDKKYAGVKLGSDANANFALLRFDLDAPKNFQPLALANSAAQKSGVFVQAVGFPYDKPAASRWGNLDGIHSRRGDLFFPVAHFSTNVKVSPGQSGSPLLNSKGEVIGMVVASPREDETYALPSNAIKKLTDDFIASGRARHGWSGLNAKNQPPRAGAPQPPVVTDIAPNSPAAEADVQRGDLLLRLDAVPITDISDIANLMFYKSVGESVRLTLQRGAETKTITLKLAERPVSIPSYELQKPKPASPPNGEPPQRTTVPAFDDKR
jgi:S1-C subfamily serine protease